MRLKELGVALAVLAALTLWGYGAVLAGQALGRPDPVDPPSRPANAVSLPSARGGLAGFEGQGNRLETGPAGLVTAVEDAEVSVERSEGDYVLVPGKRVTIDNTGHEFTLELGDATLLRELVDATLGPGDRVAVGEGALLVIR